MKQIFTMMIAVLVFSCGRTDSRDGIGLLKDTLEIGEPRTVPFPLYGCKEQFRFAERHSNVRAAWQILLSNSLFNSKEIDIGFSEYHDAQQESHRELAASVIPGLKQEIEMWMSIDPVTYKEKIIEIQKDIEYYQKPIEKQQLIDFFRNQKITVYHQDLLAKIDQFNVSMMTYNENTPSLPFLHLIESGQITAIPEMRVTYIPCMIAIKDFVALHPVTSKNIYSNISRYYEPRRILENLPTAFKTNDSIIEIILNMPESSLTPSHVMQAIVDYSGQGVIPSSYLEKLFLDHLPSSPHTKMFQLMAHNKGTSIEGNFIEDLKIISNNGYSGYFREPDSFENEWYQLFSQLRSRLDGCNIILNGSEKNLNKELPSPNCTAEGFDQYRSSVESALAITLTLLDMAGDAHSEDDDEGAKELLGLAKESLKFAADLAIGLSPAGRAKDVIEAIGGYSIIPPDFEKLSLSTRVVTGLGAVTVGGTTLKVIAKYAKKSKVFKKFVSVEPNQVSKIFEIGDELLGEIKPYLPVNGGSWLGEKGKSIWKSTNSEILQITDGKGVPYNNFFPDFSTWALDSQKFSNLNGENAHDFNLVYSWIMEKHKLPTLSSARKFLKDLDVTLHHVEDGVTIQLVPRKLHEAHNHSGGASLLRKLNQMHGGAND